MDNFFGQLLYNLDFGLDRAHIPKLVSYLVLGSMLLLALAKPKQKKEVTYIITLVAVLILIDVFSFSSTVFIALWLSIFSMKELFHSTKNTKLSIVPFACYLVASFIPVPFGQVIFFLSGIMMTLALVSPVLEKTEQLTTSHKITIANYSALTLSVLVMIYEVQSYHYLPLFAVTLMTLGELWKIDLDGVMHVQALTDKISKKEHEERLKQHFYETFCKDIKTPLLSAIGYLDFVVERMDPSEQQLVLKSYLQKSVQLFHNSLNQIERLNKAHEFAYHAEQALIYPINLNDLLFESRLILGGLALSHPDTSYVVSSNFSDLDDVTKFYTDYEKVISVLQNLILNAAEDKQINRHNKISVEFFYNKKSLAIKIAHTGKGFDAHYLEKIFQDFYFSNDFERPLLGLNLAKNLLKIIHGTISINSIKNKETIIDLLIPSLSNSTMISDKEFLVVKERINDRISTLYQVKNDVLFESIYESDFINKVKIKNGNILIYDPGFQKIAFDTVLKKMGLTPHYVSKISEYVLQAKRDDYDLHIVLYSIVDREFISFFKNKSLLAQVNTTKSLLLCFDHYNNIELDLMDFHFDDVLIKPFRTIDLIFKIHLLIQREQRLKNAVNHLYNQTTLCIQDLWAPLSIKIDSLQQMEIDHEKMLCTLIHELLAPMKYIGNIPKASIDKIAQSLVKDDLLPSTVHLPMPENDEHHNQLKDIRKFLIQTSLKKDELLNIWHEIAENLHSEQLTTLLLKFNQSIYLKETFSFIKKTTLLRRLFTPISLSEALDLINNLCGQFFEDRHHIQLQNHLACNTPSSQRWIYIIATLIGWHLQDPKDESEQIISIKAQQLNEQEIEISSQSPKKMTHNTFNTQECGYFYALKIRSVEMNAECNGFVLKIRLDEFES